MLRNLARQSPLTYYSAVNRRPLLPLSLRRHCSSKREPIEMELDFSSPNELKKMEETIQKLILHKATPDWLPFIPGASFWVPPSHGGSKKVVDLIDKISHRLPKEEEPSITTDQGWPFLYGTLGLRFSCSSPKFTRIAAKALVGLLNS
ncbi:hypothetical protein SLEP1_g13031 [Rubroshorea leprosula]|uniref:Uncharacterized protein n=1 Tax=Rubroshorea leprosula TaxID=152421 RepID=A0AAV5IQV7_9ROSI|nr:hypothetical protein SLEP1_g13031 [Rubroshorea leprosula]